MSRVSEGNGIWLLGGLLIIPFILFGLGTIQAAILLGAVIFILYFCILILNFEAGFLALIFIRSSLDSIKNFTASGGVIIGAVSIALIVLGVFYVLYSKVNILKFEDSGPFLIFLMFCGVSIVYSPVPNESLSDWLRLLSVFSVYILTRIIFVTPEKILRLFTAILISSLLPVLAAYFQLVTGHGTILDGGQHRIVGTFLHPNPFATYLMILLVFLSAQILEGTRFISQGVKIALAGALFVIFVFTFSRGAWIAFAFSMAVLGFLRYRKILGFMPVILIVSFLMIPAVKDRIVNIFQPGYTHGRSGWDWRLDTWTEVRAMVAKKPLLGHGLSAVEAEFGVLTHNDYLRLAAEIGMLGLLSYLILSYAVLHKTLKDYQNTGSDLSKSFQAALFAVAAGLLVREFADNTLRDTICMMYFWIFIAISRNMARVDLEQINSLRINSTGGEKLCSVK